MRSNDSQRVVSIDYTSQFAQDLKRLPSAIAATSASGVKTPDFVRLFGTAKAVP
jgi:hypothetical protein